MITVLRSRDKKKRKSRIPDLTVNMWLSAMQESIKEQEEPIPDGFITLDEVCKIWGVCRSKAMVRITNLETAGKVQRMKVRRVCANGKIRLVGIYKVLSK
jgi:hypothetical protein